MGGAAAAGDSSPSRTCLDCDLAVVGRSLQCDGCKAQRNRERASKWNRENRDRFLARQKAYYAADPEKAKARVKAAMDANPDRVAAQRAKQKAAETPEQRRDWYLRSKYGITLDYQREMRARQGGTCLICMVSLTADNLAVDHNHETGEVRGLLCRVCNSALGAFEADPDLLLAAHNYLTTVVRPWLPETERGVSHG